MKIALLSFLLLGLCAAAAAQSKPFEPLPGQQRTLYRFDLKKNFYIDDAAWKADVAKARAMVAAIEAYKGRLLQSPANVLAVMTQERDLEDLLTKLDAYGEFRQWTNTDDRAAYDAYDQLRAEEAARTSFVQVELKGLSQAGLDEMILREPRLKDFQYTLESTVRMGPHTLTEAQESLLAGLGPDLTSWQPALFQMTFDRTPFPQVQADGKTFDAYRDLDGLLQNADRAVREKAWKGTYATFGTIQDLAAFSLFHEMKAYNEQAKLRGFDTYFNQALFERFLSRQQVDNVYAQIEGRLPLYHQYQRFRMDQVKSQLGVTEAEIWDMDLPAKGSPPPRYTADEAVKLVEESLSVLGPEYSRELAGLLDPKNGRMDIVGGPKRGQGAFTEGHWGYFMDNYQGLLDNVATIAHESGHAIHHQLVTNHRGSGSFSEGPSYMTESFAMFNEWLVRDRLFKTVKDPALLATYRQSALDDMMMLWEIARRAKFEMISYDRVASGEITGSKGFDTACEDTGKPYDLFYARYPELELHWIRKHHYWTVPTYYVNYVFAQILALTYYQHFLADPKGFPEKYVAMVAAGFEKPPADMLKSNLGIDLNDPKLLDATFDLIQREFDGVKAQAAAKN